MVSLVLALVCVTQLPEQAPYPVWGPAVVPRPKVDRPVVPAPSDPSPPPGPAANGPILYFAIASRGAFLNVYLSPDGTVTLRPEDGTLEAIAGAGGPSYRLVPTGTRGRP